MFYSRPDFSAMGGAQSDAPPASIADVVAATNAAQDVGGEALAQHRAWEAEFDAHNDRVFAATGQRLQNPFRAAAPMAEIEAFGGGADGTRQTWGRDADADWRRSLRQLADQYPDKAHVIQPDYDPYKVVEERRRPAQEAMQRALAGSPFTLNAPVVGPVNPFALPIQFAYGMTDPFNIGSMVLAGGPTGVGAKAVVQQGLKSAAANVVGAAAEQGVLWQWRRDAGLEYTAADFAHALAGAAAFGFALDAGGRAAFRGFRAAQGREPVINDKGQVTAWRRPDPRSDPIAALDDAARSGAAGETLRKAADGDPEALRAAARDIGIADQPEIRGALQAMEHDRVLDTPPPGVAPAEHAGRVADAMRHAGDDRAPPPGDALPPVTGPEAPPERVAALLARDPLDLAAEIRERPELLSENVPWSDSRLRQAAMLSRLSDTAWERVSAGELRPEIAAIVAEHVADPARHASLADRLQQAGPRSPAEARARLAELMQGPRDAATHRALAGHPEPAREPVLHMVDDPYGADAARQLEQLRVRHAEAIARATGEAPQAEGKASGKTAAKPEARAAETHKAIDDAARIAGIIAEARHRTPLGVTVKSFADLAELSGRARADAERVTAQGRRVDAFTDADANIWIARGAFSSGRLAHETIHALRRLSLITDQELKLLAELANAEPGLWDRAAYERAYADFEPEAFADAMLQEAAAHLYEARANGRVFDKRSNVILDRVRDFLTRVRNAFRGLGYQTAEDVMRAIDRGDVARREQIRQLPGSHFPEGTLFALSREEPDYLKSDLAEAAAMADARAKAQRERQALIDEGIRERNNGFVLNVRDARGQNDPAKAIGWLIEHHGQVIMPEGMTSVVAEAKAVEGLLKAEIEGLMHEFRKTFVTGSTRERARLANVVSEAAGEATGDAAAKSFAEKWLSVAEKARQMFNGAGGDIPKLEGWFLPQVHDRLALLKAGPDRWLDFILPRLDTARLLRDVRDDASPEQIAKAQQTHDAAILAAKEKRMGLLAEHDAGASEAVRRAKRDAAEKRQDMLDAHADVLDQIKVERDKEIEQARSIRDQQQASVRPADRGVLSERFHRAKSEIERAYVADVSRANKELEKLLKRYDRKVAEDAAEASKAAAKARDKHIEKIDGDLQKAKDDAERARYNEVEAGQPITMARLREILRDSYENITSDGHGTLAANAADPMGGIPSEFVGKGKLGNRRQEHRFLHFKDAAAWMEYQAEFGGGADPFGAMMAHLTGMSKDIAAMRVLGTNPERELARLSQYARKQASLLRPLAVVIDDAVRRVKDLNAEMLARPGRIDAITDRIGAIHKGLDDLKPSRGKPGAATIARMTVLRDELMALEKERGRILDEGAYRPEADGIAGAEIRARLDEAYAELASVQDADRQLFPRVTEFLGRRMDDRGFWTKDPVDYANKQIFIAENMYRHFRGAISAPVDAAFAHFMQSLRNIGVIGRGGSMVISSIADNFAQIMARGYAGLPSGGGFGTMAEIAQHVGSLSRREAARTGLVAETYLHSFNEGARLGQGVTGHAWTQHLAERTIAWQGLGRLTDAQRMAFGMTLQGAFSDLAHLSLAAIEKENANLARLIKRYGLSEGDWDAIRLGADGKPLRVDFLSPADVATRMDAAGRGGERIAERYLGMILQETDYASPTSMVRAKAILQQGTRPGTMLGELVRVGGQFKSFAVMFMLLHNERAVREMIASGAFKGGGYAAQIALVMTLGGALVVMLKDAKSGKEQQPLSDPKFWGRAILQGGGLGIMGDMIQSETNRFGGGLASTFTGPVVGMAEDVIRPFKSLAMDKNPKPLAHAGKAITSYVPGSSLWYTSLAYQRLFADRVQAWADPQAYHAFAKKIRDEQRDYGRGFWWAPGDTAPRFMR